MLANDAGSPSSPESLASPIETETPFLSVVIVGAGICGLCAAIRIKEDLRIARITIYEKDDDLGGTWFQNRYPGCGCDVESHLYSYSFHPKPDWSQAYSERAEIHTYIRSVAEAHDLYRHIRFRTRVISMSWSADQSRWLLKLAIRGENGIVEAVDATASVVVCAMGPLSVPAIPKEIRPTDFAGTVVHTAEWNEKIEYRGKRVAVIGNAASGAQLVGAIYKDVDSLLVLQRTPNWIVPRWNPQTSRALMWIFTNVWGMRQLWRTLLYLRRDVIAFRAFRPSNFLAKRITIWATNFMKESVPPELHSSVIPSYAFGCKRVLVSSSYLPALGSPNTTLITAPVERLVPSGIKLNDGTTVAADLVVLATGFDLQGPFSQTEVVGVDPSTPLKMRDSYLGIAVNGYPNLYTMLGSYTGLAHSSVITMAECQATYIVRLLRRQIETQTLAVSVSKEAQRRFVEECDRAMDGMTWKDGGCQSWYLAADTASPKTLWPWSVFWYVWKTRRVEWSDFEPRVRVLTGLPASIELRVLSS